MVFWATTASSIVDRGVPWGRRSDGLCPAGQRYTDSDDVLSPGSTDRVRVPSLVRSRALRKKRRYRRLADGVPLFKRGGDGRGRGGVCVGNRVVEIVGFY